jgi:predicted amidohydrolase
MPGRLAGHFMQQITRIPMTSHSRHRTCANMSDSAINTLARGKWLAISHCVNRKLAAVQSQQMAVLKTIHSSKSRGL